MGCAQGMFFLAFIILLHNANAVEKLVKNVCLSLLVCPPSVFSRRLSKKLKIGKKYFQRCPDRPMGEEHIAKHREAQKRLSELEEVGFKLSSF